MQQISCAVTFYRFHVVQDVGVSFDKSQRFVSSLFNRRNQSLYLQMTSIGNIAEKLGVLRRSPGCNSLCANLSVGSQGDGVIKVIKWGRSQEIT